MFTFAVCMFIDFVQLPTKLLCKDLIGVSLLCAYVTSNVREWQFQKSNPTKLRNGIPYPILFVPNEPGCL